MQQLKYIRLHLTAAVDKISSPDLLVQPWREIFLAPLECHGDVIPNYGSYRIIKSSELFKTISETEEKSKIIPVGAVESSFLMFSKPVDICSYDHPDIAPLMVSALMPIKRPHKFLNGWNFCSNFDRLFSKS